jgi:hypothetical protein
VSALLRRMVGRGWCQLVDTVDAAFQRACAAFDDANFDSLSERDQILVTIRGLESDVNTGGFDQFFFNGSGHLAVFAPTALMKIGAVGWRKSQPVRMNFTVPPDLHGDGVCHWSSSQL